MQRTRPGGGIGAPASRRVSRNACTQCMHTMQKHQAYLKAGAPLTAALHSLPAGTRTVQHTGGTMPRRAPCGRWVRRRRSPRLQSLSPTSNYMHQTACSYRTKSGNRGSRQPSGAWTTAFRGAGMESPLRQPQPHQRMQKRIIQGNEE